MFKLGAVVVTRQSNYNQLKHFVANQVLLFKELRLPSTRDLAEILHIHESSITRALLRLAEENWIEKIDRGSSRNSYYKIIANDEQCFAYKQYYLLPVRKKAKFRKLCRDAKQNNPNEVKFKNDRGEVKDACYFGSSDWNDAVKDIV